MRQHNYYVYLMSSLTGALYIGVTNDLERRVSEHKAKINPRSFTARYNITRLIYFEEFSDINDAIIREKELKRMARATKMKFIESLNPDWRDLSASAETTLDSSCSRQKDARE